MLVIESLSGCSTAGQGERTCSTSIEHFAVNFCSFFESLGRALTDWLSLSTFLDADYAEFSSVEDLLRRVAADALWLCPVGGGFESVPGGYTRELRKSGESYIASSDWIHRACRAYVKNWLAG